MKRRILSIMTVLALCLSLCPAWAFAAEGDEPQAGGEALVVDVGALPAETMSIMIYNNRVSLVTNQYNYTDLKGDPITNPDYGVLFSSLVLTGTGAVNISLGGSTQVTLRNLNITAPGTNSALYAAGEGTTEFTLVGNVSLSTSTSNAIVFNQGHIVKMTGSGNLTVKQTGDNSSGKLIAVGDNCSLTVDTTGDVTLDAGSGSLFDNISGSNVNPISISARNITLKDGTDNTSFAGVTLAPSGTMNVNGHTPVVKVTADGRSASFVTLKDAWTAARMISPVSPATVTLLDNVTLPDYTGYWVEAGQDITFEGGDFTLTRVPNTFVLYVDGGKLTVNSGTIAATAQTVESTPAVVVGAGEFVMTGGALTGPKYGLGITGGAVQLSGGSFTGGESAVMYDPGSDPDEITDLLLGFLLNCGTETEPHYAYYQNGKPFAPTSIALPAGTFTVGECRHPGVELKKNADGSHGMSCPYCGYEYTHPTAYTATASGGIITVGEGCDIAGCGYKTPLGSLTVSIPELAYGELDKTITWDTSKLTNWTAVAFRIDELTEFPVTVKGSEANHPPQTLGTLTGKELLAAGEHTLTVKIGMHTLPAEKISAYLTAAEEHGVLPMFYLELTTGIRRGELVALLWDDLDLEAQTLTISKSAGRINGEVKVTQPKTANSVRTIYLPQEAIDLLIQEHSKHPSNPIMFPSPVTGKLYGPDCIGRLHKTLLKKAGITENIPFHGLRHTFATLAIQQGVDAKTVSSILGHYSAGFTLDTYTHVTGEMQKDAAQRMGSFIAQAV